MLQSLIGIQCLNLIHPKIPRAIWHNLVDGAPVGGVRISGRLGQFLTLGGRVHARCDLRTLFLRQSKSRLD